MAPASAPHRFRVPVAPVPNGGPTPPGSPPTPRLSTGSAPTGPEPPEESRQRTGARTKIWHGALAALGVVLMLVVCGLSSWFIMADERHGADASAGGGEPAPTAMPRDISNRTVDPRPLTVKEVFPAATVVVNPNEKPYQVLKTQASNKCAVAVEGEIAKLLSELDCSQVVRGTLRSPTGQYLATGGIFNLTDETGADSARSRIKSIVNTKQGRFNGMAAGPSSEAVATSSAHVGWDIRGHFLIYCVIARANGKPFAEDDPYARQILFDIVEWHLRDNVLGKRATKPVEPSG